MKKAAATIYFPGLNGLRAIAALIVLVWHVDQYIELFDLQAYGFYLNKMAEHAVDLFFVLSGFLITYLLLLEKEQAGIIRLKKFYLRRILRIWPLYYLALLISLIFIYFGIVPLPNNISFSVLCYTFLLANLAYILKINIKSITPLWSVGVEEQFYLLWPNIVQRTRQYVKVFIAVYIFYILLKIFFYLLLTPQSAVFRFIDVTRINIMCMGAVGAVLYYRQNSYLKHLYRKEVQLIAWGILIASCIYSPIHIRPFFDADINAFIYLILILNVATNPNTLVVLENPYISLLGKISYGIYVYHLIIIYLFAYICKQLAFSPNYLTILITVLITTLIVAYCSYQYFEKAFLRLKINHMIVKSSNEAPSS